MANVLGFFKKVMPFVTTGLSLAGPPGVLAANILGKVLSVTNPTPDSVTQALSNANMTPELQAQLAEAELAYKQQVQALGFQHEDDLLKIAADDRSSARQMQTQVRSWVPPLLAISVTLGFFGLLALLIFRGVPPASEKLLDIMDGVLGTAWVAVINYYFGSSAGSDRKTELMAQNGGN